MSNREDLLDAARTCLYEKGYARTTARDVATAAEVSLAAIGYHFGSKEALLDEALQREIQAWTDQQESVTTWDAMLSSFEGSEQRWAVRFELLALLLREPDKRKLLGSSTAPQALEGFPAAKPGRRQYVLMLFSDGDSDMESGCGTWTDDMQREDVWRTAIGLNPHGEGRTVRVRDDAVVLGDGPFAETKDVIGGFTVIECADLAEAVAIAAKHPFAREGQIEIRPVWTPA